MFNSEVWCFKSSVIDNEFYLFRLFDGFNVSVYNVGYYLAVLFVGFMHLIYSPPRPKHKESDKKTWTSSLKDPKKKILRGLQQNMLK